MLSTDALKLIGISRSTHERLFKGEESRCSPKTHAKISQAWTNIKRKLGLADRPPGWSFDLKRPWRTFFSDLIPNAVGSKDHKLSYAVHVMLQIEDALFVFGQNYRAHGHKTTDLYLAMGLPDGTLPREIENYLAELVAAQGQGLPRSNFPAWMGKAILRTFLFVLAAWEVTLLRAKTYVVNTEPFVHKYLPKMVGGKPALPIRLFLEGLQGSYGLPTNKDLAAHVEVSTRGGSNSEPQESALRQIQEWKCGNEMPGFETITGLAFQLTHSDERQQKTIALSYIKNRFIQELYDECKQHINASPPQFADEAELVGVFQEYPDCYTFHEAQYNEWIKQGTTQP